MELINSFRQLFQKPPDPNGQAYEIMAFPDGNPKHPEWTLTIGVQTGGANGVFLGFVGRLGYGDTWEWDNGTTRRKGTGRVQGRNIAIARLLEVARPLWG